MPISDCEVRDPRVRRTRQLLQNALRTLMQTRSLDEISVGDITDTATLNRATFYDHYNDKFALFEALVAGEFHKLLHEREVTFDAACPSSLKKVVLAVCDYLTQTHSRVAACQRQSAFEPLFDAAITNSIRRLLSAGVDAKSPRKSFLLSATMANAASWAIYGAAKEWFVSKGRPPAEQLAQSVVPLILPLLADGARHP